MIRIAICDDDLQELTRLKEYLADFGTRIGEGRQTCSFYTSSMELLKALEKGTRFDLFLLDIVMPGKNGIDLAEEIRKQDAEVPIIFITSSKEYALEAYGQKVLRYLLKPVQKKDLEEALLFVRQTFGSREEKKYCIKGKEGMIVVRMDDIIFVENEGRSRRYHLADGRVADSNTNRESFEKQLEDLLREPQFLQPHKSYVVNMKYIKSIAPGNFELENGEVVPISRRNAVMAKKTYLKYLSGEDLENPEQWRSE